MDKLNGIIIRVVDGEACGQSHTPYFTGIYQ